MGKNLTLDARTLSFRAKCPAGMTASTTTIVLPDIAGLFPDDFFNGKFYMEVILNSNSAGNAPEKERKLISDFVSSTGTFTTGAFSGAVQEGDWVMIEHELIASGGVTSQLEITQSESGIPQDGGTLAFYISLTDKDSGAIASANIDITSISVDLATNNSGSWVSVSTQPTFAKATGTVSSAVSFVDSEWAVGDGYRLIVSGITATIAGVVYTVPTMVWSNIVGQEKDIFDSNIAREGTTTGAGNTTTLVDTGIPASKYIGHIIYIQNGSAGGESTVITANNGTGTLTLLPALSVAPGASAHYFILTCTAHSPILAQNGVSISVQQNNQTARTNFEQVWEDFLATIGTDGTNTITNINNSANTTFNAVWQKFATLWGADGANVFNPTIQGVAQTDLELALYAMATYFSASGAAMALQVNNQTTRTNLEQALEDYFAVVGCDGTNVFSSTIQGGARTTFEAAFDAMATYFSASGAAMSIQLNNQTARTNLEQALEDYFAVVGVDGTNVLTNINNSANTTFNAVWQKFATLWGADGANVFNPTIYGSARTNLETALNNLALYLSPSAAAWSVTMNNGSANANLETTWEAFLTFIGINDTNVLTKINNVDSGTLNAVFQNFASVLGCASTDTFTATIQGATRTALDTALQYIANYFSANGAAWSVTMNNGAATTDLEATLEAILTWYGIDGTNTLTKINNTACSTLNAAIQVIATVIGCDNTNTFAPTMTSSPTTIEGAFTSLQTNFGSEYNGSPNLYDTIVTGYNSSGLTPSATGSALEILRFIADAAVPDLGGLVYYGIVTTADTTSHFKVAGLAGKGTNLFNTQYYITVIEADAAAPEGETKAVATYTTADGDFTTGAFSVAPDVGDQILVVHKSIMQLMTAIGTNDTGSAFDILKKLHYGADGTDVYPATVVNDSVWAKVLSKSDPAAASSYNNTTDSLEALRDNMGTNGASLSAVPWNAAWDAEVESECDDALVARKLDHMVAVADADDVADSSIIAKLASKAATPDWSTFVNTTDSQEMISDKLGGFSGDGGAAQDDSAKASLDLLHTDMDTRWQPEDPQTGTKALTLQSTDYAVFTAYDSSVYAVKGTITLKFPASQTYIVKIKKHAAANDYEDPYTFVVGATAYSKTFVIGPTEYVDVQCQCTTAAGQTITYYRCFEFAKNSGGAAPTA